MDKDNHKLMGCLIVILSVVHLPVALSLTFLILSHIGATTTMWCLFWITVPLALAISAIAKSLELMRE